MELVDVADSKSAAGDSVPVRVRSPAPRAEDLRRRSSALGAGNRTRTGTLSPAADFEWLYRFCFPQQSALHRSLEALILLAFLIFSRFY